MAELVKDEIYNWKLENSNPNINKTLTGCFRDFTQSLQANTGTAPYYPRQFSCL